MISACNTEKKSISIFFGKAKLLKGSVILFKRVRAFFAKVLFLKNEEKMIRFYFRNFLYTTFKANAKSL